MNLSRPLATAIVMFATTTLFGCGLSGNTADFQGSIATTGGGIGFPVQRSGIDVYAFTADEIDSLLKDKPLALKGNSDECHSFFVNLPLEKAVAHTRSGPYGGQFQLRLPKHGNFVIASWLPEPYKPCHWLVRVSTGDADKTAVFRLNDSNTVEMATPTSVALPK